jgi:hypothetical protein
MGRTAMYIMTSKLNCTPGLTLARLNVAVPVWREEAAWKRAARMRVGRGREETSGLWRSRRRMMRMSRVLRVVRMKKRIQVGREGKRRLSQISILLSC